MTRMANEFERADHDRDLRKHDTLPSRLSPPIAGALEIAMIVKGLASFTVAAGLIEQYAQTVAAEARLQATIDTSENIMAQIDAFGRGPNARS